MCQFAFRGIRSRFLVYVRLCVYPTALTTDKLPSADLLLDEGRDDCAPPLPTKRAILNPTQLMPQPTQHARTSTSHHWQSVEATLQLRVARALGRFSKPTTLEHTDQEVCPVERPERCSTSLCHRQRSTSARHVSSRAQLAAQQHVTANINDMKHGLCMPRREFAKCALLSMLRS